MGVLQVLSYHKVKKCCSHELPFKLLMHWVGNNATVLVSLLSNLANHLPIVYFHLKFCMTFQQLNSSKQSSEVSNYGKVVLAIFFNHWVLNMFDSSLSLQCRSASPFLHQSHLQIPFVVMGPQKHAWSNAAPLEWADAIALHWDW